MADKLSRRDFLKIAGVGLAAAGVTKFEIVPRLNDEVPLSWRVASGLKVCDELAKAEVSGDPEKIVEARKLAVVWTFAESASLFAKDAGMEKAGKTMEHYLYGDGLDLDISPWFEEVIDQKEFWLNLTLFAFGRYCTSLGKEGGFASLSREKFLKLFDQLSEKFRKGYSFGGSVGAKDGQGTDWFYAIGRSTYTMRCETEIVPSEDEFLLRLQNMDVKLFDNYDWELGMETTIANKAQLFTNEISQPLFSWLLNAGLDIDRMLGNINFPKDKRKLIVDAIDSWRVGIGDKVREIPIGVQKVEEWATQKSEGKIVERDMALLKKIGAKDYSITAAFKYPGKIEIPTSPTNYLFSK